VFINENDSEQIKKDEMDWTCGTHGTEELFIKDSGGERDGEMAWKS
jgi:hypothetical protein